MMTADSPVPSSSLPAISAASIEEPFALLVKSVTELSRHGGVAKAAGTKAVMRRLSINTFDEHSYGYPSFRAFLKAAADRGFIILDTVSDQDFLITLSAEFPSVPQGSASSSGSSQDDIGSSPNRRTQRRVRHDLWNGFVDWRSGVTRIYDAQDDRAFVFPTQPVMGEKAEIAEVRQRWRTEPHRYHQIDPITFEDQVAWMRAFSEGLDRPEINAILDAGFRSDRPAGVFRSTIRAFPEIDEEWRSCLLDHVIERITEWATRERIEVNLFEAPKRPPVLAQIATVPNAKSENADVALLRARLHSAIDAMPLQELMQIRIPVGYLYYI